MSVHEYHTLYFDGGCIDNGGKNPDGGSGYVIYSHPTPKSSKDHLIAQGQVYIGRTTNNEAEYTGLIEGMERAYTLGVKNLTCIGDSKLVINQMKGEWKVKAQNLKVFSEKAIAKHRKFKTINFVHVLRAYNSEADSMADKAIKDKKTLHK